MLALAAAPGACGSTPSEGNGAATELGLPAPPEGSTGIAEMMLAGTGRNDMWSVDVLTDGARVDHFDGSRWRMVPIPTSVATARGLAVLSGGPNALWVAGRASAVQARYVIARIHADGSAEQFDDALRTATGTEQIALFGRGGDAVVALTQAGLTTSYRFDGRSFVAVPAPPVAQTRIVGAPPGGLWAAASAPDGFGQTIYRFDGTSWSRLGDAEFTGTWTFDAAGEAWAAPGFGSTAAHFDGQQLTRVTFSAPPAETVVGPRFALLPAGRGRGVALYQRATPTRDGGHAVDVMYSVVGTDGVASTGVWRSGVTLDGPDDRGFQGGLGQPFVLDDGTEVLLVAASEARDSGPVRVAYALLAEGAALR